MPTHAVQQRTPNIVDEIAQRAGSDDGADLQEVLRWEDAPASRSAKNLHSVLQALRSANTGWQLLENEYSYPLIFP